MISKAIYEAEGTTAYIVNIMSINNVQIYDVVQVSPETCRFSVTGKYTAAAEKVMARYDKKFTKIKDSTFENFMKKNITRFGLYIGIMLLTVLAIAWSRMVTEVRISGTETVSEQEIMKTIEEYTDVPTAKKDIDLDELEKRIIDIKGVSNVSLEIKGNIIFVDILEELNPSEIVDYNEKKEITSKYDAVVTKVVLYSGTAVVKEGDTVLKGDTLIAPRKEMPDGTVTDIRALGDVYGRVWLSKECVFTPTIIESVRTGKSKTYVIGLNSDAEIKSPYKNYEKEESEIISPFFPIKLKKITFYETKEKEREFDYSEERENIIKEKTKELESEIPEGAEKIRTWTSEKTVDKNVVLVIYYEIVLKING